MAFNVFISYSTSDIETVDQFKAILNNPIINIFVAEYSVKPGESLNEKIIPAIEKCHLFLLLFSKSSQESEWVQKEIEFAKAKNKFILPVLLDDEAVLPPYLGDIKYISAQSKPEETMSIVSTQITKQAKKVHNNSVLLGLLIGGGLLWLASRS